MEELKQLQIHEQKEWKFGLITRTVVRISETMYTIHDLSSGWLVANVDIPTMEKLLSGEVSLTQLDWN